MHHYDLRIGHRFLRCNVLVLQSFVVGLDWHDVVDRLLLGDLLFLLCQLLILLLFALLLLLLLLPLQELIGGLVGSVEIDVQDDEVQQQKAKDQQHQTKDPGDDDADQLRIIGKIYSKTADDHMHHHKQGKAKGRNDANKEVPVVSLSDTVIEPNAVMVEPIHAAIAHPAVLAVGPTIAVTVLAK